VLGDFPLINRSSKLAQHNDAFGRTAVDGAARASAFQYTGRENDETGLYYYRTRYDSPRLHRFISEDPIWWRSGDVNAYAYVGNSPTRFIDPLGLIRIPHPENP